MSINLPGAFPGLYEPLVVYTFFGDDTSKGIAHLLRIQLAFILTLPFVYPAPRSLTGYWK